MVTTGGSVSFAQGLQAKSTEITELNPIEAAAPDFFIGTTAERGTAVTDKQ